MVLVQFYAFLAYFVTGGATASERPLWMCVKYLPWKCDRAYQWGWGQQLSGGLENFNELVGSGTNDNFKFIERVS